MSNTEDKKEKIIETKPKVSKADAIKELWRRGTLSWKLKSNQKELYSLFYNSKHQTHTWLLSRRSGKTFTLSLLAIETCLKKPNSIIKFVAPTKIQINNILRPIFKTILEDCPLELAPEFRAKDYIYYFPNGSEIQLAGSESGHAEKLRGGSAHIAIVDEAQDVTNLDYIVKSILLPTTLTTGGKVLLAGTPPKEADHDFIKFIEEADFRGSLIKKTIYDNPMITPEALESLKQELGGETSSSFRRELLCELIKDENLSVIPEFNEELEKEIVKEWPKPPFYDSYESMDLGFKDLTVVLFAYFDFRADKLIIEDEIALNGNELQLPTLIEDIKQRELALWMNPLTNELTKPSIRVSDINYLVTSEMARYSNGEVTFSAADKYDKGSAINQLRVMLSNKKIIINPKCKTLIRHLKNVRWDAGKSRTGFARSADDGHYDAVDACLYLIKAIAYNKNPYPAHYGFNTKDLYVHNPSGFYKNTQLDTYKKIFKINKRRS